MCVVRTFFTNADHTDDDNNDHEFISSSKCHVVIVASGEFILNDRRQPISDHMKCIEIKRVDVCSCMYHGGLVVRSFLSIR